MTADLAVGGSGSATDGPPRASETWHREDGGERFYIRAANATLELAGRDLVRYTREHWAE